MSSWPSGEREETCFTPFSPFRDCSCAEELPDDPFLDLTYNEDAGSYSFVMPDEDVVISTEDVPIVYCTVTFTDGLGNILKTEIVEKWQSATAPEVPEREGFGFTGWDHSFSYVSQDLTVNAKWRPAYIVTFVDGLGNRLKEEKVVIARPATAPEAPIRKGYIFDGWDKDFSRVFEDMTVTALWKIDPSVVISIQDAKVVLAANLFTYNGEVQKPGIIKIGSEALKEGTDYAIKWSDASSTNAGSYTLTVIGKGRYTGTTKAAYTIKPKAITPTVTLAKKEYTYNGKAQKPAVTVKDGNVKLTAADYTVTYASGHTNTGTHKGTVELKGNYSGSADISFKIVPAKVSLPVAKTGLTYNGARQTGVAAAANYTVTGGAKTEAGTYTAKATLKDTKNYVWADGKTTAKSVKWTIGKANLKSATIAAIKDQTFTGASLKPAPVVKMTLNKKSVTLKAGTDYKVTYKNNAVPGAATLTITGQGNFTGSKSVTFKITKAKTEVTRLYGDNRYETSRAIAEAYRNALGVKQFDAVCVADGTNYPDALAGSFLAALKHAPILSVDKNNPTAANTQNALAYIRKNLKAKGTVYLLGGAGSVPEAVENQLKSYGFTVKRIWGPNRDTSNLAVLKEAGIKAGSEIIVCTGADFADALSASATGKPVLLVGGSSLLAEQKEFLQKTQVGKFTIIGDQSVVPAGIENDLKAFAPTSRITGRTTYQRSIAIAKKYFPGIQTHVNIADGKNFPDALCGGPLAVLSGGPLLLVDEPSAAMEPVLDYVRATCTFTDTVYGGPGSVSDALLKKIQSVN